MLTAKGSATRRGINSGAATVIRTNGLTETTLDDIRNHTWTSKSQLFHDFSAGRDELLLAVAGRVLTDQEPHLSRLTSRAEWDALVMVHPPQHRALVDISYLPSVCCTRQGRGRGETQSS